MPLVNPRTFSELTGSISLAQMGSTTYAVGNLNYVLSGVDFNSGNTDSTISITLPTGFTRYRVGALFIMGASASLTTATFGLFTAAAAGGTAIVASGTACTVSTASEDTANNMQAAPITNSNSQIYLLANIPTLYFRVQTPQGSAATAKLCLVTTPLP